MSQPHPTDQKHHPPHANANVTAQKTHHLTKRCPCAVISSSTLPHVSTRFLAISHESDTSCFHPNPLQSFPQCQRHSAPPVVQESVTSSLEQSNIFCGGTPIGPMFTPFTDSLLSSRSASLHPLLVTCTCPRCGRLKWPQRPPIPPPILQPRPVRCALRLRTSPVWRRSSRSSWPMSLNLEGRSGWAG